jgi:predicted Zn-dependent protease
MDGVSLERRQVRLFPMKGGFVIEGAGGAGERLPFEKLLLVSDLPDRTILGRTDLPDWRLSVAPPLSERRLERLRKARRRTGRTALVYASVAAVIAGLGALTWYQGGAVLEAAAPHVPTSITVPMGEAIVKDVADGGFCRTPEADAALDRLLERLMPDGGGAEPVVVRIADLALANAMAAPGGQVLLTRGLIEKASGPDEVAGVLAHELGHVEYRHATQMLLRNVGMAILLSGANSDVAVLGDTFLQTAMSREKEREADEFAIAMLARADISPKGLVAYFERTMPASGSGSEIAGTIGGWASTHPPTPERLASFREAASRAGPTRAAMSDADWAALRKACGPPLQQAREAS